MKSTIIPAAKFVVEINRQVRTTKQNVGIQKVKEKLGQSVNKTREGKLLHGQYIRSVDRQLVGGEDTLYWLLWGELKGRD